MRSLIELRDQCKGYLKDTNFVEALSLFLAIAHLHPNLISKTAQRFREDRSNSGTYFLEGLAKLQKAEPDLPWENGCLDDVPSLVIGLLALYVQSNKAWVKNAANLLINYYFSEVDPSRTYILTVRDFIGTLLEADRQLNVMERYSQTGNMKQSMAAAEGIQGAVLDPFCGLGTLTLPILAEKKVNNEGNRQLALIGSRLAITQDRQEITHSVNYVMASCISREERQQAFSKEERYLVNQKQFDLIVSDISSLNSLSPLVAQTLEEKFSFLVKPDRRLPTTNTTHGLLVIQHAIRQLKHGAQALFLVTNSWLALGGYNKKVRNYLIENSLLTEVILLDEINHRLGIQFSLIRIQPDRYSSPRAGVIFRNQASVREAAQGASDNVLSPDGAQDNLPFFEHLSAEDFINLQTDSEILAKRFPFQYKHRTDPRPDYYQDQYNSIDDAINRLSDLHNAAKEAHRRLEQVLLDSSRKTTK